VAVLFDVQGVQSPGHAERGIARYLLESASALERWHPGAVDRYLVNPDFEVPGSLEPLTSSGRIQFSNRLVFGASTVYHVGSPVELGVPLSQLWPPGAQSVGGRLVATLYDLIPRLFPDVYLVDPVTRRRYETRLELIRRADRILAISHATAADAVEHLGVDPDRVTMVGTGVSARFRPPGNPAAAFASVQAALPHVDPGFILYTGGIEFRKNVDGLLDAYAQLGERIIEAHQLVVVCRVQPGERAKLDRKLAELRIADRVLFTGFVPDDVLVALYQTTDLFVFPSLYEGFGLPVAEAIASGAPVAISRIPALTELIDEPAAQFDPRSSASIAEAVSRCLSDDALRLRLSAATLSPSASWRSVSDRTAEVYEEVRALGPRAGRRARKRIAFVTPLPPQRSGVADDSYRLVSALARHCDVDAVVDGGAASTAAPPGARVVSASNFRTAEALARGYDKVFYTIGNSEFHAGALELLRQRRGVVIAHDVRLSGLYGWVAANRPHLVPGGFSSALRSMYGSRLPAAVGEQGWIDFWDANRHGVFMAREAIAHSESFLVHSEHAAQLARLDAAPADEHKVHTIPFRFLAPEEAAEAPAAKAIPDIQGPVVGTFGMVSPAKQTEKLLESWEFVLAEISTARLAVVGSDGGSGERECLRDRIAELGLDEHVMQTGDVDEPLFRSWIARSDLAVQLRGGTNGETSAVVAQCLSAGVPTIVTDIGSARELPDDVVVKVDREVTPWSLAGHIVGLLRDPDRRAGMSHAGVELARENSFERVAKILYERYVLETR